jgi:hypothetical protein
LQLPAFLGPKPTMQRAGESAPITVGRPAQASASSMQQRGRCGNHQSCQLRKSPTPRGSSQVHIGAATSAFAHRGICSPGVAIASTRAITPTTIYETWLPTALEKSS